ncbi:MAG: DUF2877 domain-containing protein [Candidatus Promineifilaceae bacterium]
MTTFTAVYLPPALHTWCQSRRTARVMQHFRHAVNLLGDDGRFFSIVSSTIDAAPFAITLFEKDPAFNQWLLPETAVTITPQAIHAGPHTIDLTQAALWQPRPPWSRLHHISWEPWLSLFPTSLAQCGFAPASLLRVETAVTQLQHAIAQNKPAHAQKAATALAGLGSGLTPAGDDLLTGAMLAIWAQWPADRAASFCQSVYATAVPRTTILSQAWLRAASAGEAALAWHELVDGLAQSSEMVVCQAITHIKQTGHTSGTDALTGFALTIKPK